MKKIIKDNVLMIKEIINEVLDSEDERNDNENFYAVLDRLEIILEQLNQWHTLEPNEKSLDK